MAFCDCPLFAHHIIMKKNLVLLGAFVALVTPVLSLRADDGSPSTKSAQSKTAAKHPAKTAVAAHSNREVIYITNRVVTGSNIPVTVTRYQGHNITSSPLVSYDQSSLADTGALDVGTSLTMRDPAISFGRGR